MAREERRRSGFTYTRELLHDSLVSRMLRNAAKRDAWGPLTAKHKCTVYGDDDSLL